MTEAPGPRARKPERAPTLADLAERDRYATMATASAEAVRGSAKTWQTAITAFITLVTTGVIIKGRDSTADVTTGWRFAIVILAGAGLLLAVFALWQTVSAEAGTHPGIKSLPEIRESHGTLAAYQAYLTVQSARRLRVGISSAAAAMALLITGIVAIWLAPEIATQARAYIAVTSAHSAACGTPLPSPAGELWLSVTNAQAPAEVPFSLISAISLATACQ
jgi:hypothetical protein